jgi:peptidyl-prolyl cis-trans isomerase D
MIRFLQSGNKAAKYILGGLLTLLALSMVIYLIPGFMSSTDSSGRSGVVASVGGTDILSDDVVKMTSAQLQQQHYPANLAPYFLPRVLQQLVQAQEIRYEAERMGLMVSDQEVRDEMQHGMYKTVFFPDGKWIGQQKYEELLTTNNSTVAEFERNLREQLLARKLFTAVTAGVSVSPAEVEQAYRDKNTKVKFQYAVVSLEDVQKEIKPTEADLKAFYSANLERYQNSIPEKRQVRYFVLLDKDAESKVAISPSEIQRYYNTNLDQYRMPDRARVRHILISTPPAGPDGKSDPKAVEEARAKAAGILKEIRAGGDFAELAKKNSQDPGSKDLGGELGWILKGQMVAEFEKVAFAQSPGQISDLVQSSYGFHIIQTEEKESARVKPLSEVKDDIEKTLRAEKVSTLLDQKANAAVALAQKQGLDKAAAQNGAQVIQSNPVSRGEELPGIGASREVMSSVFAVGDKAPPQVERFGQGYVVFQVTRIDPPKTPAFEEVKDRVTGDFKSERANALLQKKTKELADRAHVEHDLAKAAKEAGAALKTSDLVARTAQVPQLGSMSGPASVAFSMKPGEISGPLSAGANGAVLQLTDRQEPSVSDPAFAQGRDALVEQLTGQKREQALELFMSNLSDRLEKEKKVKINKAEMDRLTKGRG